LIRFIHIKKNGGTSVYKFLRKHGVSFALGDTKDIFKIYNQHIPASRYKDEDSWKFCVSRNPYSRVVSFYNWMKQLPKYKNITFEKFVKDFYNIGRASGVWNLQTDYMLDNSNINLIDKIFKFETMSEDIPKHFNIDAKFPHLNPSTPDDYRKYYNDELQEIVYNKLKYDFEYLEYNKCLI